MSLRKEYLSQRPSLIIHICFFVALGCSWAVCGADIDAIDQFMHDKLTELKIPGAQLAVVQDNRLVKLSHYGIANLQNQIQVDDTTVFNLASITKAFTSVAAMQLVEKKLLQLDVPISKYVSDLPPQWREVTLHQLLAHTSGLPDVMNSSFRLIDSDGEAASWKKLLAQPMLFSPGEKVHYNQTNYLLLGKIIQGVSGDSYASHITSGQLQKVVMRATQEAGFAHFEQVVPNQARTYRLGADGHITNVLTHFPAFIRAGAGMSSNARELSNWVMAFNNNVFFETDDALQHITTPYPLKSNKWQLENPSMHPYGMGWYVVTRELNPKLVSAGGGQAAITVYPEDNLTIILLTNLAGARPDNWSDDIAEFYIDTFALSNASMRLKQFIEQNTKDEQISNTVNFIEQQNINVSVEQLDHLGRLFLKHQKPNLAARVFNLNSQLHSRVQISEDVLNNLSGIYRLPDFDIKVIKRGAGLFIQATGDRELPVFALSDSTFELHGIDARLRFLDNKADESSVLELELNGTKLSGQKLN